MTDQKPPWVEKTFPCTGGVTGRNGQFSVRAIVVRVHPPLGETPALTTIRFLSEKTGVELNAGAAVYGDVFGFLPEADR